MMIEATINDQEILEETEHVASSEEIREYAKMIGINPDTEPDLMNIAKAGIDAPLPPGWKACRNANSQIYYFNFDTGQSLWDHPMDQYYKDLVIKERSNKLNETLEKKHDQRYKLSNRQMSIPSSIPINLPSHMNQDELKIIPDSNTKQFYHDKNLSESSNSESEFNLTTESRSEDYGRGVDFGLDKSITDRLSQIEPPVNLRDTLNSSLIRSGPLKNTNSSSYKTQDSLEMIPKEILLINKPEEEEKIEEIMEIDEKEIDCDETKENLDNISNDEIEFKEVSDEIDVEQINEQKEKIKNDLINELQQYEQEQEKLLKVESEKRLEIEKEKLELNYQTEKNQIYQQYQIKREKLKEEQEKQFQTYLNDLCKYFSIKQLEITKEKYTKVYNDLNVEIDNKIKELKLKNIDKQKLIDQFDKDLEKLKNDYNNEKEHLITTYQKELIDIKNCHKSALKQLNDEKSKFELELKQLKLKEKDVLKTDSSRELKYTENLQKIKNEYNTIKIELINKKSDLESLQYDINTLKEEKRKLEINLSEKLSKLHKSNYKILTDKESYDSAVLVDDIGVSNSYDAITTSLNDKTPPDQIISKAKYFLQKQSLTKSKSISLPSLHNLESSAYFQRTKTTQNNNSILTNNFVLSLQKVTADLTNIVESIKSDTSRQIQQSDRALFSESIIPQPPFIQSKPNDVFHNDKNEEFEKNLRNKYYRIFSNNNNTSRSEINTVSSISNTARQNSSISVSKSTYRTNNISGEQSIEERLKQHRNWLNHFKNNSSTIHDNIE